MKKEVKKRTRLLAFIIYPESADPQWIEKLQNLHVPGFISPMHTQEVNEDGEILKDHYHVFLMFEGVKSQEQFDDIKKLVGGVGQENVSSKIGYARYLCHLDEDPNIKKHYDPNDVIELGGADYLDTINTAKNKRAMIREMIIYVRSNNVIHYTDLKLTLLHLLYVLIIS